MRIGELAKITGTAIETIRYYERERLLPPAARSTANYRVYDAAHEERLSFIRHCRSLDMALEEIRDLLRFKDAPQEHCSAVNALLDDHIGHVAARIRELRGLEKELRALRDQCRTVQSSGDCGILRELSSVARPQTPRRRGRHVHGAHR